MCVQSPVPAGQATGEVPARARVLFRWPPAERRMRLSPHGALRRFGPRFLPWPCSVVDAVVAGAADDQGLATAVGHLPGPAGLVRPVPGLEVFQPPDLVGLDGCIFLAELAPPGREPGDEFCRALPPGGREIVADGDWRGPAG